jgi:hypothetical protein
MAADDELRNLVAQAIKLLEPIVSTSRPITGRNKSGAAILGEYANKLRSADRVSGFFLSPKSDGLGVGDSALQRRGVTSVTRPGQRTKLEMRTETIGCWTSTVSDHTVAVGVRANKLTIYLLTVADTTTRWRQRLRSAPIVLSGVDSLCGYTCHGRFVGVF